MNIRFAIGLICLLFIFITSAESQENSQQRLVVPESFSFDLVQDLIWANNQYVAVGKHGLVMTSADGKTWTTHRWRSADDLSAVTWDGHQYLAVGKAGLLLTSPNGIIWQESVSVLLNEWRPTRLHFFDDRFYLVGTKKYLTTALFSSKNGTDWSLVENTPANTVDIASGNGQQVIVSRNGIAYRSLAQGEWQPVIIEDQGDNYRGGLINSVAWNGQQYVALVEVVGTVLTTSTDGITWNIKRFSRRFDALHWNGRNFVVAGDGGIASLGSNGEWNFTDVRLEGYGIGPMMVIAGEHGTTLVTSSGYHYKSKLLLSRDGNSWQGLATSARLPPIGQSVTYNFILADTVQKNEKKVLAEDKSSYIKSYLLIGLTMGGVGPVLYLILQIIAVLKTKGWWRVPALLPIFIALPLAYTTFVGYQQESNLWPLLAIMITPFLLAYLVIFIIVYWLYLKIHRYRGAKEG